jgi:uncharacterized protein YbcI
MNVVTPSEDAAGSIGLEIANGITSLHRQYYGRGAASARTLLDRDYVAVFMKDVYTTAEQTLIDAGEFAQVAATRQPFQQTMREAFSAVVEKATGRKVIGFMSNVHENPDLSAELFALEPLKAS